MDFKKAIKILFLAPVVMGGCQSFLALLLPAERPSWSGVLEPLVDFWTAKISVMQPAIERSKFPFATATVLALGWTLLPLQALCWLTPTLFFPIPPDTPRDGFDTLRARVKAFFCALAGGLLCGHWLFASMGSPAFAGAWRPETSRTALAFLVPVGFLLVASTGPIVAAVIRMQLRGDHE